VQRFWVLSLLIFASCASYKKNIMFKVGNTSVLKQAAEQAQKNYIIQKNDLLKLAVYTKNGERIIDPDFEFLKNMQVQNQTSRPDPSYLVDMQGTAKFPLLGAIVVEGLTLRQAEEILQKEYVKYYADTFVRLEFINKRIIVLGAPGGQVIPLTNENIRLTEALALAKGVDNNANAQNIRVLRGDEIFVADLSTFEGYQKNNMVLVPGDIVYIEPIRRPLVEGLRDYTPILSLIGTLATLVIVIATL